MGLTRFSLGLLVWLLLSISAAQCRAADVSLQPDPWPAGESCVACAPIQFGKLDMRLPLGQIGKILVSGGDDGALHILPRSLAPKQDVVFVKVPRARLLKDYEQSGYLEGLNISTNEQLFDTLGKPPGNNESLVRLRRIEGIDTATRYTKTSHGRVHVYWIQSPLPSSQRVYVVIDGNENAYMLFGNVTREFYDAVLSNLRIEEVP